MKALCEDLYMQVKADLHSANFSHASDTFRWQMPTFQSPFGENEIWVICKATCSVNVTYIPTLPFWTVGSRPPGPSWNLPFWDDPGLNVRYLRIFQVDHTFYKLDMEILTANNEIRCVRCSHPPSLSSTLDPCQQKHLFFWH